MSRQRSEQKLSIVERGLQEAKTSLYIAITKDPPAPDWLIARLEQSVATWQRWVDCDRAER